MWMMVYETYRLEWFNRKKIISMANPENIFFQELYKKKVFFYDQALNMNAADIGEYAFSEYEG